MKLDQSLSTACPSVNNCSFVAVLQSLEKVFLPKDRRQAQIAQKKAEKLAQQKADRQAERLRQKQADLASKLEVEQAAQHQLKRAKQDKRSQAAGWHLVLLPEYPAMLLCNHTGTVWHGDSVMSLQCKHDEPAAAEHVCIEFMMLG